MRRFCSTNTTNVFVKSGSAASSSPTWSECFHYRTCSPCLFASIWTRTWSGHNWVLRLGGSPIVLLFLSAIVGKFLNYSQARWSRSFQQVKLLSNATFISRSMKVKDEFSLSDFQAPSWVHSTTTSWWTKMVCFVLKKLEEPLLQCDLYHGVRAVCYGITLVIITFSQCSRNIIRTVAHCLLW